VKHSTLAMTNVLLFICNWKGIRRCMASWDGISVDTVANLDINIVEQYKSI